MDELETFCTWYLEKQPNVGSVPFDKPVWMIENVTSILMYREAPFQVQMFAVPGGTIIPEHTHPNVDSIEVYVGGEIYFSHSGEYLYEKDELEKNAGPLGLANRRGMKIRVRPNDLHGGTFGPGGGVFLSVQHWLNGVEPHCVAADYNGVTMGEHHLGQVVNGDASVKDVLTEKDAASLVGASG